MSDLIAEDNPTHLVLMHLSDIHFRRGRSNDAYDLDSVLRQHLEVDAETEAQRLEGVDAIVVTGDIAYSGHQDEYGIAGDWLLNLATKVGCDQSHILTVPGNHDVDRSFSENDVTLAMYQEALRRFDDSTALDSRLQGFLRDPTAQQKLYEPLGNYNNFARQLSGCNVDFTTPYWERNFALGNQKTIRIRGLNSVLVSNKADNNRDQKLVIGSHQYFLQRPADVEYVTLCHHPPDWVIDQDSFHNNLAANMRLQLFGHKHIQRPERIDDSIRLIAGAVHPDRTERGWIPRYNIVEIELVDRIQIDYRIHPRIWHENNVRFGPEYDAYGNAYHGYTFPVQPQRARLEPPVELMTKAHSLGGTSASAAEEESYAEMEIAMGDKNTHLDDLPPAYRLVARFVDLPEYKRTVIVERLGLSPSALGLSEFEYRKQVFQRAAADSKLADLWDLVEAAHSDNLSGKQNPFRVSVT